MVESSKWRWRNVEIVEKSQFISTAKPFCSLQQQHCQAKSQSVCHNFCVELYCCCLYKIVPLKKNVEKVKSLSLAELSIERLTAKNYRESYRPGRFPWPGPTFSPPAPQAVSDQTQLGGLGESRLERRRERQRERKITLRTILSRYWNWSRKRPVQVGERQWEI